MNITRALRHRNYRLFFGGQLISLIGTFLTNTATPLLAYLLTKDEHQKAWLLGVVGFAGQVPLFFLAPWAGVWVDRINRQKLLVITQTLSMLQSLALAVLALLHIITIPEVIVLAACQGIINSIDMPGRQAFVIEMVTDREDLPNAIALNSTMVHGARLIGPALAGLLFASVGPGWCFLLDGLSYIAVILALMAMKITPRPPKPPRSVLAELREGIGYVWNFVPMRALLMLMATISLTALPAMMALMPIFGMAFGGNDKRGAVVYGILGAASACGALTGALLLAARKSVVGLGRMIAIASAVYPLAAIAFALCHHLWLALLILPFAGWAMLTNFAGANTILQTLAPDDKRGRVMSLYSMAFVGATPFGLLLAGAVARHFTLTTGDKVAGAAHTIILFSCVTLIAAVIYAFALPGLRKIVRPIYIQRGILPAVAVGLQETSTAESTMEPS